MSLSLSARNNLSKMFKIDFSHNSYTKQLITLALPVVMSLLLQVTYSVIDLYWVGRLGSDAVAAVGSAGFFVNLGIGICSIVSIGAMVKVAHAVGAKDCLMQNRYAAAAVVLGLLLGGFYVATLLGFSDLLISIFDIENDNVNHLASSYLRIIALGALFSYINLILTAILNAHGQTKLSFRAVLYGNLINLILDPIFILLLDWGVEGAAAATVISWIGSFIYFYTIIYRKRLIHIEFKGLNRSIYAMLIKVGSAGAAQRILFTLIAIAIGRIIASFGSEAIAAQKVGLQIESLSFMIIGGLQQALSIVVGQRYGAGEFVQIDHLYRSALKLSGIVAVSTTTLFLALPDQLISIFVDDSATVTSGRYYLIIIGVSQMFMALEMVTGGLFNGLGKTYYSAAISIIFTSLRIPLAIFLSSTSLGIIGVWCSISATSVVKGIVSSLIYRFRVKQLLQNKI